MSFSAALKDRLAYTVGKKDLVDELERVTSTDDIRASVELLKGQIAEIEKLISALRPQIEPELPPKVEAPIQEIKEEEPKVEVIEEVKAADVVSEKPVEVKQKKKK
jgi:hypothetical protein